MFNLKILHSLLVASFLAFSGLAHAATSTISDGSITATINDYGTFASLWDPVSPSPEGTPGLNHGGTEYVNLYNPSSWFWLTASGTDYISQYGAGGVPGTFTTAPSGEIALTFNPSGSIGLLETWHITSPNSLAVSVQITNNGVADLTGVNWGVGLDPDQTGITTTTNTILGQGNDAAVSASDYYNTGKTISLVNTTTSGAFDIAAYIGSNCCSAVDPLVAFAGAQAVGYSVFSDSSISLAYNIGMLGIGETATFGYSYVFAPVPEPETYGMLLAGLALVGFSARRRMNT